MRVTYIGGLQTQEWMLTKSIEGTTEKIKVPMVIEFGFDQNLKRNIISKLTIGNIEIEEFRALDSDHLESIGHVLECVGADMKASDDQLQSDREDALLGA